jgi:hypothetical protein
MGAAENGIRQNCLWSVAIGEKSAADLRSGLTARVHLEFGENPLGMMAGSMGADLELPGNGLIGEPLRQEIRYLDLPASEAKSFGQHALSRCIGPGADP